MVRPMKTAILQGVGNVLLHSGWEISNVCIGGPGIFEIADIETEPFYRVYHRLEAGGTLVRVRLSQVDLILAAIAEKEIGNGQMSDTNCSIGPFVSI